ncbi:enoyl-CoA hydratase/isomerase family protein [Variovorax sp. Sphag1AA]|uniref:enoyl-CoA hydratase/isomerase family protein n=1 Tax=Variovorax sp. Sphag1AA TaxID=2587027 RepID=UPI00161F6858|nr:enoyl-CoA hydratase-related protein [Variovorax sp. Sphag1AA]MBB3181122.1 2-(1,2-epoxy-1,2-dihydrophenyl)acetyl-CoA isomerase [Variovorax sp. Sphag1AA]
MSELLGLAIDRGVATITLNRPEKLNAFTDDMLDRWVDALEACRIDPAVRVIVITGTGRAFTTGGDVESFGASAALSPARIKERLIQGIQRLPRKMAEIDKPIIAALNGFATGGGLDIALACDIRFAAHSARLAETYARMGLIPGGGGAFLLPRIVGMAKALEMLWSCDWVDAAEAERIGLVNRVFADDELMERTYAFARQVADAAPISVQLIKRVARLSQGQDLDTALDIAASNLPIARTSEDHLEAVRAFKEKRKPQFQCR